MSCIYVNSIYYEVLSIIVMNILHINNLCSAFCGGAWGATGYGILRLDVNEIFPSKTLIETI